MRIIKGCTICANDVLGTKATGYYCKNCNLLFTYREIDYSHRAREARDLVKKEFSRIPMIKPLAPFKPILVASKEDFFDEAAKRMHEFTVKLENMSTKRRQAREPETSKVARTKAPKSPKKAKSQGGTAKPAKATTKKVKTKRPVRTARKKSDKAAPKKVKTKKSTRATQKTRQRADKTSTLKKKARKAAKKVTHRNSGRRKPAKRL